MSEWPQQHRDRWPSGMSVSVRSVAAAAGASVTVESACRRRKICSSRLSFTGWRCSFWGPAKRPRRNKTHAVHTTTARRVRVPHTVYKRLYGVGNATLAGPTHRSEKRNARSEQYCSTRWQHRWHGHVLGRHNADHSNTSSLRRSSRYEGIKNGTSFHTSFSPFIPNSFSDNRGASHRR